MKITAIAAFMATAIFASTLVSADTPALNIDPARHPHLAAAQNLSRQAFDKIEDARRSNDWDMNGHAARALNLLIEVNNELKAAAEAANKK
ncbi:MAG: hypothetical protein ACLP2F_11570 [Steroidobacteraceae bacterium]